MKKRDLCFITLFCSMILLIFTLGVAADDEGADSKDTGNLPQAITQSDSNDNAAMSSDSTKAESGLPGNDSLSKDDSSTVDNETSDDNADNPSSDEEASEEVSDGTAEASDSEVETTPVVQKAPTQTVKVSAGWQTIGGYKYYYRADGSYYKSIFASISGKTYYFDSYGHLLYGVYKYSNGYYYYSDTDGIVKTSAGWTTTPDGKKHYVLRGGKLYASTRVAIGKSTYFYGFDSSANLITSEVYKYGNAYYYAGQSGVNQYYARWVELDGNRYYVRNGGKLYSCIRVKIGSGNNYYGFNTYGVLMVSRVYTYGGYYYYAGSSGINQYYAKFVTVDEKSYYVTNGGKLYRNVRVKIGSGNNYYCFGNDCAMYKSQVYKYGGYYYYAGSSGINQYYAKLVTVDGESYYVTNGGKLLTSTRISIGNPNYYYAFASDAVMIKSKVYTYNGNYYYASPTGLNQYYETWLSINGAKYYVKTGGTLYRNQFIHTADGKYYYAGSDAKIKVNTSFTVDGYTYTSNADGVINEEIKRNDTEKGIDVSVFNGTIDWLKVKAAGITFAIIRVAGRYGGTGSYYIDEKFAENIRGAYAVGIKVGVYFFSQAINGSEARGEAKKLGDLLQNAGVFNMVTLPMVIDTEDLAGSRANKISVATRTTVIREFCNYIIEHYNREPMIYASTSWLNHQLNMSLLRDYKVWVAQWGSSVTYTGSYQYWQYISTGTVNGIKGNVDLNYMLETIKDSLIKG